MHSYLCIPIFVSLYYLTIRGGGRRADKERPQWWGTALFRAAAYVLTVLDGRGSSVRRPDPGLEVGRDPGLDPGLDPAREPGREPRPVKAPRVAFGALSREVGCRRPPAVCDISPRASFERDPKPPMS